MRYKDQFLEFHRIARRKFELSGLRTGSIRDQLIRSHLAAKRLALDLELIDEDTPLLIVGGGAAGACAALTASALGVEVVLLEQEPGKRLFGKQSQVTTRWIDPVEYDWPLSRWRPVGNSYSVGKWPTRPHELPFSMQANNAHLLAYEWHKIYDDWPPPAPGRAVPFGKIQIIDAVNGRSFTYKEEAQEVSVQGLQGYGAPTAFGAVLSCIGLSGENVSIKGFNTPLYRGYEFWSDDPFQTPFLGIARQPKTLKVLISGGGDGALQDFQRIVAGKMGRELFEEIERIAGRYWLTDADLLELLTAEDIAKRAHAWRSPKSRPTMELQAWHEAYEAVAERICSSWRSVGLLKPIADHILAPHEAVQATLILRDEQPDFCYGLNRFLFYILIRLVECRTKKSCEFSPDRWSSNASCQIITGHFISDVSPIDQSTDISDPISAHQVSKFVHIAPRGTSRAELRSKSTLLGEFDAVIVRHGANSKPLFRGGARVPEQMIPYEIPA